jgi:hypothetical protein
MAVVLDVSRISPAHIGIDFFVFFPAVRRFVHLGVKRGEQIFERLEKIQKNQYQYEQEKSY